jgi:hypothetical protein
LFVHDRHIDHAFRPLVQIARTFGMRFSHDANMGAEAKKRQR